MIGVAATIAVAVAMGIAAERRWEEVAREAARGVLNAMLYAFVPFIVFFNVARLDVDENVGGGIGLAYVMLALTGLAAWWIATRVLRLSRPGVGATIVATMQVNSGYVGLPLTLVFLGSAHLAEAAAYDAVVTLCWLFGPVFAVGAAFGAKAGDTARQRVRAFFTRNPVLLAVAAALAVPDAVAAEPLVDASRVLVFALLPLGFFALGVILATEADEGAIAFPPPLSAAVATVVALRLAAGPALLYLLALALIELPASYLLLSAMPCGISTLIVAHAYGLDMRIAAGAVAWSTALVVVGALVAATVL